MTHLEVYLLKRIITFYDRLFILAVALVALISLGILNIYMRKEQNEEFALLTQGSEQLLKISLNKEDGIYPFSYSGGEGSLEVKSGKVRMLPMDLSICPRSICSDTGWIENSYQSIICLPNSLIVQLVT